MDSTNSDLDLLENLSKKISDLIYQNKFNQISEIDAQRKALIKKIMESVIEKKKVKERIRKLVKNNISMIETSEKKLKILSKNQNRFSKRLKAYSFNK
ncbi:MAG: hypothetical protein CMN45_01830 [SAR116 cluster bacterium]|nr:hypothetical protein [SAR116 cluster bacterium]